MSIKNNFPPMGSANKTARNREPVYSINENQVKGKCRLILDGHI